MDDLATRLADVRRNTGLSTRGFAAALLQAADYEVSHTSVGGYEHGTGVPAAYVEAVSRAFSVSEAWLLTGDGLPAKSGDDEVRKALRRIADVMAAFAPAMGHAEAQLEAFFRLSPDPFLILTPHAHIARWNQAFEQLVGYTHREIDEAPLLRWVHGHDREAIRAGLLTVANDGEETCSEFRLRTATDEYRQVECRISQGSDLIFAVLHDVTEERRAEEEAEQSRARLEAIFQLAQEAIVLLDDRSAFVDVNPATLGLTGYTREELLGGLELGDVTQEGEMETLRARWAAFLEDGKMGGTHHLVRKDGGVVDVEFRAVAHVLPGLHLSVLREVPGMEERELARKLSLAVKHSGDCILVTDRDGRIEYVNPAFEETTGYSLDEVRGATPRVLRSGHHDEAFYRELWTTILAGETFRGVFVNRRKNGELYRDHRTIAPVLDDDGRITHFVSTGRDLGPPE